jgi:predicted kinase
MKELILLRGIPSAGKSTLAKLFGGIHIEADRYFVIDGEYKFDPSKITLAHNYCRAQTGAWMRTDGEEVNNDKIVVSNTFSQEWEMEPYFELAKKYNYRVHSVIVEKRHDNYNDHNVPKENVEKMVKRFEIKLN